ncbi:MAG: TetR/AcrR family transcriptional regulator [Rhodobacteraceae bacterium]|nr:MAG: TetR/AcrR family transcriptional regulator [Paracoccaceae bacterium]
MDAAPPRRARNAAGDILDAAHRVVARDGAGRLTLDAVAREVGMTKGGVLYNFPSKTALLAAMLTRMLERFEVEAAEAAVAAAAAGHSAPTLRGMLEAVEKLDNDHPQLHLAIVAAGAEDPAALAPLRAMAARLQARILDETADGPGAMLACAAADGLIFQRLMDMPPADPALRAAVRARILAIADALEPRA